MTRMARLALSVSWVATAALAAASPASADVDCTDLKTRDAAQTYLDGRTGDPDRLDADADGRACESNDPSDPGTWPLIALGVLLAGGLLRYSIVDRRRKGQHTEAVVPVAPVLEPAAIAAPLIIEQAVGAFEPPGQHRRVLASAKTGSVGELARALRMVPYAERMGLLEEHASAHGTKPQDVLNALAERTSDLELQGWALAGYDPPWTVRVMRCSCVDGMRNFRLQAAADGSHYWACASCHASDRHLS